MSFTNNQTTDTDPTAAAAAAAAAEALDAIVNAATQSQQVNYIAVSCICWLVYDIILTLSREITYIWKSRWSLPKVLYILARYYGPCYLIITVGINITPGPRLSIETCRSYWWYYSLGGDIIFTTLVNVILVLRLCALFGYNRKIMILLIGLLTAEFGVEIWVSAEAAAKVWSSAAPAPPGVPITGCLAASIPVGFSYASWIPCLALAAFFFAMTIVQAYRSSIPNALRQQEGRGPAAVIFMSKSLSPLVQAIIRDGSIYYLVLTMILLVCTVTTHAIPLGAYQEIALPWLIGIYSFTGTRLIMNLREAAVKQNETATWASTIELGTFRAVGQYRGEEAFEEIQSRRS